MFLDYNFRNYNYRLFLYVLLLNITGVLIIRSASNQDISMVLKQIVGILVGLTAVIILSLVDYHRVVSFAPVIFLLSDGSPNDDWKKGLDTLKQNKWFQHGLKIALGIGSKVNMDVLRAFTGNDELAVQAKNADQLRELIKLLAVTSSQIGSRSLALVDSNGRQPAAETVAQAKQQVLVEEIRTGAKDILGEAVDLGAVNYDEGW